MDWRHQHPGNLAAPLFLQQPLRGLPECTGLGVKREIGPNLVHPGPQQIHRRGAIQSISLGGYYYQLLEGVAAHYGFSLDTPVEELAPEHLDVVLLRHQKRFPFVVQNDFTGAGMIHAPFEGIINNLKARHRETNSEHQREELEQYMSSCPCPACRGARLKPEALAVKVGGPQHHRNNAAFGAGGPGLFQRAAADRAGGNNRPADPEGNPGATGFSGQRGSGLPDPDRGRHPFGGEAQRIRLATQIGSGLMGVLYILDEPSIGLHQRDNQRLLPTLEHLRDLGNTLIVVEHDEDTMLAADYIIDIGPGAGEHGGRVVATGTYQDIMKNPESITGQYLSGKRVIQAPLVRRRPNGRALEVLGARENNLKTLMWPFP